MQECKLYVLFGYPGSGKGTFAEILKERGYRHISTGEILRTELKNNTPLGMQYKREIESCSKLLPENLVKEMILTKVEFFLKKKEKLVLDGFPKTIQQAKCLDRLLEKYSLKKNACVVYLDVPLNVALTRIQTRETCNNCGKIYNSVSSRPKHERQCDSCGAPLGRRPCDTKEGFYKRILLFNKTVNKVLLYYSSQGRLKKIEGIFK